jgi:hypothetical protein
MSANTVKMRDDQSPFAQASHNQNTAHPHPVQAPVGVGNTRNEDPSLRKQFSPLAIIVSLVAFIFGVASVASIKAGPDLRVFWIPLAVLLFILIASVLKDHNSERRVATKLNRMTAIAEETKVEIAEVLENNLRPRVITLDNHEKVLGAASQVIADVLKNPEEDRFLIFIGAASLGTEEDLKGNTESDDVLSPAADFRNKLTTLDVKKIPITRYVSLFTKEDLLQRRHPTRKNYLQWIEKQIGRLKGNPNYVMIDCVRAQPWGGSRSSIITHGAFMDIVGEGDSGILIKDQEIARTIRERTESFLADANKRGIFGGGNPDTIVRLEVKYEKKGRKR